MSATGAARHRAWGAIVAIVSRPRGAGTNEPPWWENQRAGHSAADLPPTGHSTAADDHQPRYVAQGEAKARPTQGVDHNATQQKRSAAAKEADGLKVELKIANLSAAEKEVAALKARYFDLQCQGCLLLVCSVVAWWFYEPSAPSGPPGDGHTSSLMTFSSARARDTAALPVAAKQGSEDHGVSGPIATPLPSEQIAASVARGHIAADDTASSVQPLTVSTWAAWPTGWGQELVASRYQKVFLAFVTIPILIAAVATASAKK